MDPDIFRRILVPVDFSTVTDESAPSGLSAKVGDMTVEYAGASARAISTAASMADKGEIRLIHVTPALDRASTYSGPAHTNAPIKPGDRSIPS